MGEKPLQTFPFVMLRQSEKCMKIKMFHAYALNIARKKAGMTKGKHTNKRAKAKRKSKQNNLG